MSKVTWCPSREENWYFADEININNIINLKWTTILLLKYRQLLPTLLE